MAAGKMEPPNYHATITLQMLFTKSSHQKPSQTEMHHSENGLHWLKKRVSGTPILTDTLSLATNLTPPKVILTEKETALLIVKKTVCSPPAHPTCRTLDTIISIRTYLLTYLLTYGLTSPKHQSGSQSQSHTLD